MASAPRGGKTTRSNPRSNPNPREPNKVPTGKGAVDEENYEAEDKEKLGRAQQPGARTKDRTTHTKPSAGHSGGAEGTPPRWKKPKAVKHGAFLFNRYETSEEEEAVIKGMRDEEEDEAMHADVVAAIEAESDSVLANFGTEDLAKVVLITIKAAVPAIVKAVQKQLSASVDCSSLTNAYWKAGIKRMNLNSTVGKKTSASMGLRKLMKRRGPTRGEGVSTRCSGSCNCYRKGHLHSTLFGRCKKARQDQTYNCQIREQEEKSGIDEE
ncbi:hypothetical protein ABVT39_012098 [Epinephelus coioides]